MLTTLLYPFIALSALGLILSILAHVGSILGLNVPPAAFALHVGIFVVWIPTVFVSNSLTKNHARKDFWKVALRGAPKWMRYMTFGFLGYAMLNFILFMFVAPSNPSSVVEGAESSVIRGFSGHWMAFYSAALALLYSSTQIKQKDIVRKCPNGHKVSFPANYCERCGEHIDVDEQR